MVVWRDMEGLAGLPGRVGSGRCLVVRRGLEALDGSGRRLVGCLGLGPAGLCRGSPRAIAWLIPPGRSRPWVSWASPCATA